MEKKHVSQLDDGMCAMACEQMRQIKESVSNVKSTDEDKRCLAEGMEVVRKAIASVVKQARGEELQRVAEFDTTSFVFSCTTHQGCFQSLLLRCHLLSDVVMT